MFPSPSRLVKKPKRTIFVEFTGEPLPAPCLAILSALWPPYSPPVRDNNWGGMTHGLEATLTSITRSVDEELRLYNAYLVTENRILRQQMTGSRAAER